MVDKAIDLVCDLLIALINFLPVSPVHALLNQIDNLDYLGYINYFIPFDFCAMALNSWLVCVGIYYGVKYAKQFINYIKGYL